MTYRILLRTLRRISDARSLVHDLQRLGYRPSEIISELINSHGASHGYSAFGRYYLRLATVEATCVDDRPALLIKGWLTNAQATLDKAGVRA